MDKENMLNNKLQMFENRLVKMYRHKSKIAAKQHISCYRIYDNDIPEFPLSIELYGEKLYVAEYLRRHGMSDEAHEEWLNQSLMVISRVLKIHENNMYVKQRKKMSHRSANTQYEKQDAAGDFFTVEENGLKFLVNLTDYLDTGLFLDHRVTRKMVMEQAAGKHVLNLFCYTGSFSVYAAAGGAASVTSVDLSKTYLKWAEDNFSINRLKGKDKFHFIHADVLQYLKTLEPEKFDIVILDPPTFSNSKRMEDFMDIQRDHVQMINDTLIGMKQGGVIYFSTNFTRFVLEEEKIKASGIKDITRTTTGFDFEGRLKRFCYKIIK